MNLVRVLLFLVLFASTIALAQETSRRVAYPEMVNFLTHLKDCTPGTFSVPHPELPEAPTMHYTIKGLRNGLCEVTQRTEAPLYDEHGPQILLDCRYHPRVLAQIASPQEISMWRTGFIHYSSESALAKANTLSCTPVREVKLP